MRDYELFSDGGYQMRDQMRIGLLVPKVKKRARLNFSFFTGVTTWNFCFSKVSILLQQSRDLKTDKEIESITA